MARKLGIRAANDLKKKDKLFDDFEDKAVFERCEIKKASTF